MLSPGEMQRLAFLRLFYHRPSVAFMDEATSAISVDLEELVMRKCWDLDITMVNMGHRPSLKRFHKNLLEIGLPEGGWTLTEL